MCVSSRLFCSLSHTSLLLRLAPPRSFIAIDTKASNTAKEQRKELDRIQLSGGKVKPSPLSASSGRASPNIGGSASGGSDGRASPAPLERQQTISLHDDKKNAISRVEFFACLMHIAVNKYVKDEEDAPNLP